MFHHKDIRILFWTLYLTIFNAGDDYAIAFQFGPIGLIYSAVFFERPRFIGAGQLYIGDREFWRYVYVPPLSSYLPEAQHEH